MANSATERAATGEARAAATLPDFLRTISATHWHRDGRSGIVFAYRGEEFAELRFATERHAWRRGWWVARSWRAREGGMPKEAREV